MDMSIDVRNAVERLEIGVYSMLRTRYMNYELLIETRESQVDGMEDMIVAVYGLDKADVIITEAYSKAHERFNKAVESGEV